MGVIYLVVESDIETASVIGVYESLAFAILRAKMRHHQLEGWDNMTVSIEEWPTGGGYKKKSYDYTGKAM